MSDMENISLQLSVAQIVQGGLFFLGALVGVAGYLVRSRLKAQSDVRTAQMEQAAELRSLQLQRTREKLDKFLSPLHMIIGELLYHLMSSIVPIYPASLLYGSEGEAASHKHHIDSLTNGAVKEFYIAEYSLNLADYTVKGKKNLLPSFVGKKVEAMIRQNPDGEIGKTYVAAIHRILPLCNEASMLIKRYGSHLIMLPELNEYRQKYPALAQSLFARFLMPLQLTAFTSEMKALVEGPWARGDYSVLYPRHCKFPLATLFFYIQQYIEIRERETTLGLDTYHKFELEKEVDKAVRISGKTSTSETTPIVHQSSYVSAQDS